MTMSWTKSIPLLAGLRRRDRDRFERFNIVIAILLAGWTPSILMLVASYTILTNTLESKILHDRQTFVQLIAHLVGDDLGRTGSVLEYYQSQPDIAQMLAGPNPEIAAKQCLAQTFYSHPRIDGMFLAGRDGRLVASLPPIPPSLAQDFSSDLWREGATSSPDVYVSPVHPRLPDQRMSTDIVGAVRAPDGTIVGFLGVSVLVERIGRRLSSIDFADQSVCQVLDQNGTALFTNNFRANPNPLSPVGQNLLSEIGKSKSGHIERHGNIYSFSPVESTGWVAVVEQPKAVAYKPVHDLVGRMTLLAIWLMVLTTVFAILGGKLYRRQTESARRLEREVIFNEKILANMPTGIAFVDPSTRRFLHANDAFAQMAHRFGAFPGNRDITEATYDDVQIAPAGAIERVLSFGTPFQLIEHPFKDKGGMTHFVNITLLRVQRS